MTGKIPDPIKHITNLVGYLDNWITLAKIYGCDKEVIDKIEELNKNLTETKK